MICAPITVPRVKTVKSSSRPSRQRARSEAAESKRVAFARPPPVKKFNGMKSLPRQVPAYSFHRRPYPDKYREQHCPNLSTRAFKSGQTAPVRIWLDHLINSLE